MMVDGDAGAGKSEFVSIFKGKGIGYISYDKISQGMSVVAEQHDQESDIEDWGKYINGLIEAEMRKGDNSSYNFIIIEGYEVFKILPFLSCEPDISVNIIADTSTRISNIKQQDSKTSGGLMHGSLKDVQSYDTEPLYDLIVDNSGPSRISKTVEYDVNNQIDIEGIQDAFSGYINNGVIGRFYTELLLTFIMKQLAEYQASSSESVAVNTDGKILKVISTSA